MPAASLRARGPRARGRRGADLRARPTTRGSRRARRRIRTSSDAPEVASACAVHTTSAGSGSGPRSTWNARSPAYRATAATAPHATPRATCLTTFRLRALRSPRAREGTRDPSRAPLRRSAPRPCTRRGTPRNRCMMHMVRRGPGSTRGTCRRSAAPSGASGSKLRTAPPYRRPRARRGLRPLRSRRRPTARELRGVERPVGRDEGHERAVDADAQRALMLAGDRAERGRERERLVGREAAREVVERRRAAGGLVAKQLRLARAEGARAGDGRGERSERRAREEDDVHPDATRARGEPTIARSASAAPSKPRTSRRRRRSRRRSSR